MKKWKFPILIAFVVLAATVLIIFGINSGKTDSVNEPAATQSEQIKNANSSNNSDDKSNTESSGTKTESSKGNTGTKSGDKSLPIIADGTDKENSQSNTEKTESSVVPDKATPTPAPTDAPNSTAKPTSTPNATTKPAATPTPDEGNPQPPNNTSDVIELPVIPVS